MYRNSWDKCFSDYLWMLRVKGVKGSFYDYIFERGEFHEILKNNQIYDYVGDHLYKQKSYFFLNGKKIEYDTVIEFDTLDTGLEKVKNDLSLRNGFFKHKINQREKKLEKHYSEFYNFFKKQLVYYKYKEDIEFFNFKFEKK